MKEDHGKLVGFTCAYTPLPLIDAAGFTPYRIFPMGDSPDQAGSLLHDNICPHVKRVLDRAMAEDLPELAGTVFMDSCESMRRLADAWRFVHPSGRQVTIDLPFYENEESVRYLAGQLKILSDTLSEWAGEPVTSGALLESIHRYSGLAMRIRGLEREAAEGRMSRSVLQAILNRSVTQPVAATLSDLDDLERNPAPFDAVGRAPVLIFGNVMPDPETLMLFEESGCLIVDLDTCTGARQHVFYEMEQGEDPYVRLARSSLARPPCARSVFPDEPGRMARLVLEAARRSGARGVVAHVMKFCDPYLARIPAVLETLKREKIPSLILEGDCTLRSFGQYRTRIEAFAEILSG
jgi:benzoyl-CoA reductase/2-hydroxyglutaryl-CoA dehydratase subunit BcrC/BadD/HgdB